MLTVNLGRSASLSNQPEKRIIDRKQIVSYPRVMISVLNMKELRYLFQRDGPIFSPNHIFELDPFIYTIQ